MSDLPERASLEHLRKQAKRLRREHAIPLSEAQHQLARGYGFASWSKMVHQVRARGLEGMARALILADVTLLAELHGSDPAAAVGDVDGLAPLLVLLRRSTGTGSEVRECARLLLDAGADPDSHTIEWGGQGRQTALYDAVQRRDLSLVRMLVDRGATKDEDAFYHAC